MLSSEGARRAERLNARSMAWAEAMQAALRSLIEDERGDGPRVAPAIQLVSLDRAGTHIEVEMRFPAGQTYCCVEPGCHLATHDRMWWSRLRELLYAATGREPPPLTITFLGSVERGAIPQIERQRLWPAEAGTYRHGPLRELDSR